MNWSRLSFAVAPVAVAAGLGGLGARRAPAVYAALEKPSWAPPAGVFGPVWSALYTANGVAGWRLFERAPASVRGLHVVQLAVNTLWPIVFFGSRRKRVSLLVIGVLDGLVTAEVIAAARVDPASAALLGPYLAWCGFATALNASVGFPPSA